jgi:acetyl esterase/lipase
MTVRRSALPATPRRLWHALRLASALAVAAVLAPGCSPLTSVNDLFVSRDGYRVSSGLSYGPSPRQVLDVYVPEDAAAPAKVVVFYYGGAWRSGSRSYYRFLGQALTREGVIVVVPDYRVYPEARFPGFVEDGALALRWVEDNIAGFGGDVDDIWLMGHSAGAHIAALLITDERYLAAEGIGRDRIRGFVGLAGPYAIDPLRYRTTRPAFAPLTTPEPAQPIAHVAGNEPPMLLLHGGDDGTVWPINSHAFADRVNGAGGRATVVEYPDLGHIGILLAMSEIFRGSGDVFRDTVGFLTTQPPPPGRPTAALP